MEFHEDQYAPAWVWALVGGVALISGATVAQAAVKVGGKVGVALAPTLGVAGVMAALCRMTTRVDHEGVHVVFGLVPIYRKSFMLAEIERAVAETYSPLREFGGWGIRGLGKNRALNMQGNRGVRLTLKNGDRMLIGSARAEDLAMAINSYRR